MSSASLRPRAEVLDASVRRRVFATNQPYVRFRPCLVGQRGMVRPGACRPQLTARRAASLLGSVSLAVSFCISLASLRVLSNPLNRVMFRNKTLDHFRFAIGP